MTAQEYLKQTSPNNKFGLRAELQKYRLRRMVENEMEMYHKFKLKTEQKEFILDLICKYNRFETDSEIKDVKDWLTKELKN